MPIRIQSGCYITGQSGTWAFSNMPFSLAFWLLPRWFYDSRETSPFILRDNFSDIEVRLDTPASKGTNANLRMNLAGYSPSAYTCAMPWDVASHVAIVVANDSGNKVKFYINGVLANTTSITSSSARTYDSMRLGAATNPEYRTANFDMDDLAVWARALSPTEVMQLRDRAFLPNNLPGGAANHYWSLDGTPGATPVSGDAGLNSIGTNMNLTSAIYGPISWINGPLVYSPPVTASAYVGPSGKTLIVHLKRNTDQGRTYATAINTPPQISVNGGVAVTLSTEGNNADKLKHFAGSSNQPYIAYSLPRYGVTVNQGDTVTLTCAAGWANCPEGQAPEQTVSVENQAGTEPYPVPTTERTMRVGMNFGYITDWGRLFIPDTNIAPFITWGNVARNENGIPTSLNAEGYLAKAPSSTRNGCQIPPDRDIAIEFKGGDVSLIGSNAITTVSLRSTTTLPGGWTRKIYRHTLRSDRTTNGPLLRLRLDAVPVEDIRAVYVQASPGMEYSFDHPPEWHPDVVARLQNCKCIRTFYWHHCFDIHTDKYSELVPSTPYGWSEEVFRTSSVSHLTATENDAPGWAGFYDPKNQSIDIPIVEVTTSESLNVATGTPISWRSGTTSVSTEYGGSCAGNSVAKDGGIAIAIAPNRFRCLLGSNVYKATYFKGAQELVVSDSAAIRPDNGPFTVGCWIKIENSDATGTILLSPNNFRLWYDGTTKQVKFTSYDSGGAKTIAWSASLAQRTHYHVIAEYDTSSAKISLRVNNGSPVDTMMGSTPSTSNSGQAYVGSSGGSAYFNGMVSGLAVWKRLLTPAEQAWLYNPSWWRGYGDIGQSGNDGATLKTNLAAWWNMGNWRTTKVVNSSTVTDRVLDQHSGAVHLTNNMAGTSDLARGEHARVAASTGLDWAVGYRAGNTQPPARFGRFIGSLPDCDMWLNIPYMLNDASIESMIRDAISGLPRGRRVYLELGNEPWNYFFDTFLTYAHIARGSAAYGNNVNNYHRVYLDRWARMVDIAKAVFAEARRSDDLWPVINCQAVNAGITTAMTGYLASINRLGDLKALAIAPYLRLRSIFSYYDQANSAWIAATEADQLYDYAFDQLLNGANYGSTPVAASIAAHRAALNGAGAADLPIVVYEASVDHVWSITGEYITTYLPGYTTVHPRARNFYHRYMQLMQDAGVIQANDFYICGTGIQSRPSGDYEYVWPKYWSLSQLPGVGDGSDGGTDNRNFMTYNANGVANGDMKLIETLASPIGKAYSEWGGLVRARLGCGTPQITAQGPQFLQIELPVPFGGLSPYTFQWHRGQVANFMPGPATLLPNEQSARLIDTKVTPGVVYYYCCVIRDSSTPSQQFISDMVSGFVKDQKKPPRILFRKRDGRPLPRRHGR
jgi:hypothetical protein